MSDLLIIDSSAFIAILLRESEAERFGACIRSYSRRLIVSATYVECSLVLSRWQDSRVELDNWLSREDIAVAAIDGIHARIAADAFTRFGKGRTRPA